MTNPKEALEWYERKRVEAKAMADRDCNNCKHNKADGCSRWECEYEPVMSDLISRQDALDAVIAEGRSVDSRYLEAERIVHESDAVEALSMLPSADRPTGEWVLKEHLWECDQCGCRINRANPLKGNIWNYNFCPNCGAKMGGEEE